MVTSSPHMSAQQLYIGPKLFSRFGPAQIPKKVACLIVQNILSKRIVSPSISLRLLIAFKELTCNMGLIKWAMNREQTYLNKFVLISHSIMQE